MTRTIEEINVDLDGVMVNFLKTAVAVSGINPEQDGKDGTNKVLRRDFWKAIERHVKAGNKFFEAMEPMEDAFILWEYLQGLRVPLVINSATGHVIGAAQEKRNWVRKHLGHEHANSARFVRDAVHKSQYAGPTKILIDDRRKAIDPWVSAGGIGVLHVNAHLTIEQLKELGL